jgi:hypothetical protein
MVCSWLTISRYGSLYLISHRSSNITGLNKWAGHCQLLIYPHHPLATHWGLFPTFQIIEWWRHMWDFTTWGEFMYYDWGCYRKWVYLLYSISNITIGINLHYHSHNVDDNSNFEGRFVGMCTVVVLSTIHAENIVKFLKFCTTTPIMVFSVTCTICKGLN